MPPEILGTRGRQHPKPRQRHRATSNKTTLGDLDGDLDGDLAGDLDGPWALALLCFQGSQLLGLISTSSPAAPPTSRDQLGRRSQNGAVPTKCQTLWHKHIGNHSKIKQVKSRGADGSSVGVAANLRIEKGSRSFSCQ